MSVSRTSPESWRPLTGSAGSSPALSANFEWTVMYGTAGW